MIFEPSQNHLNNPIYCIRECESLYPHFFKMDREVYIYLSSNSSKGYFPSNNSNSFTTVLPEQLFLKEKWEAALIQLQNPGLSTKTYVTVLCDILEDVIFQDNKKQVLRRCTLQEDKELLTFTTLIYKPIKNSHVHHISLHIIDEQGERVSFSQGELKCTLHLRKCPL